MADKKRKYPKPTDRDQQKNRESHSPKNNISDIFLSQIKDAFEGFNKIPEQERAELYGNQKYLEQFWEYFKQEHSNLLDRIDQKDLPRYIKAIEDQWFSLATVQKNAGKLSAEFKSEDTEQHVMEHSLKQLQDFCENENNQIPQGTFKKFADAAWFSYASLLISSDGKFKNIDDISPFWKAFIEKEAITISDSSAETIENILNPNYNPTERIMVSVLLSKIKKIFTWSLRSAFDAKFSLPISIFVPYQDLLGFRDEWRIFIADHASEIDEALAKQLDALVVTNWDIQQWLFSSLRKTDTSKWFSEQERYFRSIFNSFVTRQLFEEVQTTQETIDHYLESIGNTFKEFPPYVNDIFTLYPFDAARIDSVDSSFVSDLNTIDLQLADFQNQYNSAPESEKKEIRKKIKNLKQERENRKWHAYIAFLETKNPSLATVFTHLLENKFNFASLSADQQQFIVSFFVKNKLEDTIKNKVPELLAVDEVAITKFMTDLFDLKKMDLTLPTKDGPVPLSFVKKEFFASAHKQLIGINDLEDIKNLPLNFVAQLTDNNAAFFEESAIFDSIYTDFVPRNNKVVRINDSYKVLLKKDWKTAEGYLSAYSPIDEQNQENPHQREGDGKELYLYSEPITSPNQQRQIVSRNDSDPRATKIPVVIRPNQQQECDIEILDKKLNINGDAFGALLLGYVLGQQDLADKISPEKEEALAEKLGKLNVYKDKEDIEESEEGREETKEDDGSKIEKSEKEKFMNERKQLKWHGFPEPQYKDNFGFVKWTRLFTPFADSEVPPMQGKAWLQMEIVDINSDKETFTVKIHWGELRLGKNEWAKREFSMNGQTLSTIKSIFWEAIYKIPDTSKTTFDQQMNILNGWWSGIDGSEKYFWSVKFDWSKFVYSLWNYAGKEITHFGLYQPKAVDEDIANQTGQLILYKIKHNPNGTVTVSGDSMDGNSAKNYPARDMDYTTFMIFIKEKWLQPKCKEQLDAINPKDLKDKEVPTTVRGFSINNVVNFFKSSFNKINDGIKKYDEERSEELTDILTNQGQLWGKIWWLFGPFDRVASSFESMGMDYYLARDSRIWKKVDTWVKFYEDYDYTKLYNEVIWPMLDGKIKIHPHYKIAAILLVHLKKGKWPYAKNLSTTDGKRVWMILWKSHQQRYLAIREKKIRELEENAHIYGGPWADQIKNELVELEMRYMVHVMDARHMWSWDPDKYYFQSKYSQKFVGELEGAYTSFFKQDGVNEWFSKNQDANFEFATVEYFRQLSDRPQQALPFLKVMATKAINDTQWQVFESAVLAGILSGVFLNMTYSSTQSYIQKICRTRWFVPGLFAKDIKQQSKMQRLLDLFSGGEFSKKTSYNPADYSFRNNKWPKKFIETFKNRTGANIKMKADGHTREWVVRNEMSAFLDLTGKNVDGKTLLDLHSDPKTSASDKILLEEYIKKSNEQNETLDHEVSDNTSSLTWSILTKSQSVVDKMIKINEEWFAAKDWDEKQNMQAFSQEMENVIPQKKLGSSEQIKFFLGKFFNWFGERFSWSKKIELLKRLKWCNDPANVWTQDANDILYYSIVWEIIQSLSSRDTNPPHELLWALDAWKNFFKNNLDTIIHNDDVLTSAFGIQAKTDLDKYTPQLESWETATPLLDREESMLYLTTLGKEQKAMAMQKKRTMSNTNSNYLNKPLYDLAERLAMKCSWFSNRFKKDVRAYKKDKYIPKATWAKINNPETIEQIKRILEGKPPLEDDNVPEYPSEFDDRYWF